MPSKVNRLNSKQFITLLPVTDAEHFKVPRRDGYSPARPQLCTNIHQLQLLKEKCFSRAVLLPLLPGIRLDNGRFCIFFLLLAIICWKRLKAVSLGWIWFCFSQGEYLIVFLGLCLGHSWCYKAVSRKINAKPEMDKCFSFCKIYCKRSLFPLIIV